jgi:hypothetical protein
LEAILRRPAFARWGGLLYRWGARVKVADKSLIDKSGNRVRTPDIL